MNPGGDPEEKLAGGDAAERIAALERLVAGRENRSRRGVDLHLHSNYSFSSFRSPCEAVWQAVREGLAVLGINDHYTTQGFDEFRDACRIAGIPATFSMEAVGMERDAEAGGLLINDPGNPGRVYLCAKGITRIPDAGSPAAEALKGMRDALERRNREMTSRVGVLFLDRLRAAGPSWEDVERLTPAGNTTERHIAKAAWLRVGELAGEAGSEAAGELLERLCVEPATSDDPAEEQNLIRSALLKAGGPCFVPEEPEAFVSMDEMRLIFLGFGAVPTYPVLLDPITDFERDVPGLLDKLAERGWHALEVIPHRNTRERLGALVDEARRRNWPVFSGTEHNTPVPGPLLHPLSLDAEFEPWFEASAAVLLGHQAEVAAGRTGFVDFEGRPGIADPAARFEHFRA
ncbi:MAG: PHP domain-containing protein, partial [Planctomycetota bacterium]